MGHIAAIQHILYFVDETVCGWQVKLRDPSLTRAISELFWDDFIVISRYIKVSLSGLGQKSRNVRWPRWVVDALALKIRDRQTDSTKPSLYVYRCGRHQRDSLRFIFTCFTLQFHIHVRCRVSCQVIGLFFVILFNFWLSLWPHCIHCINMAYYYR